MSEMMKISETEAIEITNVQYENIMHTCEQHYQWLLYNEPPPCIILTNKYISIQNKTMINVQSWNFVLKTLDFIALTEALAATPISFIDSTYYYVWFWGSTWMRCKKDDKHRGNHTAPWNVCSRFCHLVPKPLPLFFPLQTIVQYVSILILTYGTWMACKIPIVSFSLAIRTLCASNLVDSVGPPLFQCSAM